MKILYISNKPIYPLVDGGCIAMNQFLKCLINAGYDIKNFTISTHKHPFEKDAFPEELYSIIRPTNIEVDTRIKTIKALSYLFKKGSYNIDRFTNDFLKLEIKNFLENEDTSVVILESIYLAGYISTIRKYSTAKIIIRSHNVEFLLWERQSEIQNSIFKKIYLKKLAKDLKIAEVKYLNKADGICCISKKDKQIFQELGITKSLATIPVSIETNYIQNEYEANSFFHIGSMNWGPNIEAINWLVNSIFPSIRKQLPDAKLYLAGSNMSNKFLTDESNGIEVIGFVEDVSDFMINKGVMLVPLKSGSGVRIKIIEGMNLGIPIVTTKIGAEGIDAEHQKNIIIAKNEEDFVNFAVSLSESKEKRSLLGKNAKEFISKHYQIEHVTKKLIGFIEHIS